MLRSFILFIFLSYSFLPVVSQENKSDSKNPEQLLLKDYRPKSIYKIPDTEIKKAKYPVIDMHSHDYAKTDLDIKRWVKTMDEKGIEKTIILSFATGTTFDSVYQKYATYGDRFEIWCGFDLNDFQNKDWEKRAIKELERCYKMGARGVGEVSDKGLGIRVRGTPPTFSMHIDDPRMKLLLKKCAELNMPINIHVAEPYWMYEKMDEHNDGLMNSFQWRVDLNQEGILDHSQLIETLENAVRDNPETTFIACHFANCSYDLSILSELLNKYPNLYADISARFGETAPIPRYMLNFYNQHQDQLLYGTDMGMSSYMYETTFKILETTDEHFYRIDLLIIIGPVMDLAFRRRF